MALPAEKYITPEEYLAIERLADYKSEYYDGELFAMAGGSKRHNAIAANVTGELRQKLKKKPCLVFNSDQKIYIEDYELYTYPDVSLVCGKLDYDGPEPDVITNPILIVEVLSESTAGYDRGKKFEFYRSLSSFRHYILIDQERVFVEHFYKDQGKWIMTVFKSMEDALHLDDLECDLAVAEIYDKITWLENDSENVSKSDILR